MNIQQLEYIIAVNDCRHFVRASEKCFVTQATLSMMIKKLEEELNVKIFDGSCQPDIKWFSILTNSESTIFVY